VQTPIEFLFDFASPNAYLSYHVLKDVAERHDAALSLTPVLLGGLFKLTNNQAPMQAFADVKGKLDYDMLETQRFIAAHRLDRFRFNPYFPINTISLMRGFIAARQMGVEQRYVDANLVAMWEQEKNMGDPSVAQAVWSAAGLDAEALLQAIQTQWLKMPCYTILNRLQQEVPLACPHSFWVMICFLVKSASRRSKRRCVAETSPAFLITDKFLARTYAVTNRTTARCEVHQAWRWEPRP